MPRAGAPAIRSGFFVAGLVLAVCLSTAALSAPGEGDWTNYANDVGASHYSPLDQITPANVAGLKEAWSYRVDWPAGKPINFEATPLKVGDMLYVCLPHNDIVALDAETGAVRWKFEAHLRPWSGSSVCRGLSYYEVPGNVDECPQRILMASVDAQLRAVDAKTGKACESFGTQGKVDLLIGLGKVKKGYYTPTSPPTIVRGVVVVGSGVPDNGEVTNPSGVIRGYDAATGKFLWAWDSGRPGQHGEPGPGERYTRNSPNSWSMSSGDEKLGLVYVPTGNANPDYYGAHRTAQDDKYSTSVVAIDVATGDVRWSFQTVHHDLWDYDNGAQPVLVDIPSANGPIPALIQSTKTGQTFLLDRRNGHPLAEVIEKPVPQGGGKGDWTAKTQPWSVGMPQFTGPDLTEEDMWGLTPIDALWCRIKFREADYRGPMTPPSADRPWIYSTGFLGGIDWGSVSVDEAHSVMIVNSFVMASRNRFYTEDQWPGDKKARLPFPNFHQQGSPYFAVYTALFRSPIGMPCQRPPYGMISGVDLKTHKLLWTHPLGTSRDAGPFGWQLPLDLAMGAPTIGGSVSTKSGLAFIAATLDEYFRAFDVQTGKELWRVSLPSAAFANPMAYTSPKSGREFVVISAGGSSTAGPNHGVFVKAFALPATH